MKRSNIITLLILLTILLIVGFFVYLAQQNSERRDLDSSAAATAFKTSTTSENFLDMQGNAVELTEYLGQTLVVNSWASWSPSSVAELRLLTDVAKTYENQGVVVIGINRAEPKATAENFLRTLGLENKVLLIIDSDDRYYNAIGGYTMPETVFYNKAGEVVRHERGALSRVEVEYAINLALEDK